MRNKSGHEVKCYERGFTSTRTTRSTSRANSSSDVGNPVKVSLSPSMTVVSQEEVHHLGFFCFFPATSMFLTSICVLKHLAE